MTVIPDADRDLSVYHFGLVVPDLEAAVEQYVAALDFRFAKVREIPFPVLVDGEPRTVELLATYSKDGPPYLELIEERSGSTWAADAFGMNHMGFWAKDMTTAMARLEASGSPGRVRDASNPPKISYHQSQHGIWIELVDQSVGASSLNAWLATSYGVDIA
jgi:catechol 2,3-dioxygenase-like lactoylglutathione lyase family enzyme